MTPNSPGCQIMVWVCAFQTCLQLSLVLISGTNQPLHGYVGETIYPYEPILGAEEHMHHISSNGWLSDLIVLLSSIHSKNKVHAVR